MPAAAPRLLVRTQGAAVPDGGTAKRVPTQPPPCDRILHAARPSAATASAHLHSSSGRKRNTTGTAEPGLGAASPCSDHAARFPRMPMMRGAGRHIPAAGQAAPASRAPVPGGRSTANRRQPACQPHTGTCPGRAGAAWPGLGRRVVGARTGRGKPSSHLGRRRLAATACSKEHPAACHESPEHTGRFPAIQRAYSQVF